MENEFLECFGRFEEALHLVTRFVATLSKSVTRGCATISNLLPSRTSTPAPITTLWYNLLQKIQRLSQLLWPILPKSAAQVKYFRTKNTSSTPSSSVASHPRSLRMPSPSHLLKPLDSPSAEHFASPFSQPRRIKTASVSRLVSPAMVLDIPRVQIGLVEATSRNKKLRTLSLAYRVQPPSPRPRKKVGPSTAPLRSLPVPSEIIHSRRRSWARKL